MKDLARRAQAAVRSHPRAADALLAVVFAAAAIVANEAVNDRIGDFDPSFRPASRVPVVLAVFAMTLPLAWRRRFPFSVAGVFVAAYLVGYIVVEVPEASVTSLAGALALYSVAVHGQPRFRNLVLSLCLGALVAEVGRQLFFAASADELRPLLQSVLLTYNAVLLTLPWVLGAVIRSLRERERELADRAAELQRERAENARQAVFAERVRIARELHDVVAHHVSVMGVQAGAARRVMERQPDKAAAALATIEESSRQAVVELHSLLGFLRNAGEADERSPQPGLAQLDDLVAQATQGPLTVDLSIEGDPRPLSPTLEVSAYRIIQEALTNTRKHSGGSRATVRVQYGQESLEVEVVDDGAVRPVRPTGGEGGQGLIGMRERATLHGGHLRVGPRQVGGFAVHATFPLSGTDE